MKKTKHFDYKIYELEEKAKTFLLILIVFTIGFLIGYWCKNTEYEDKITRQAIDMVDLKESIDRERMIKNGK